MLGIVSVNNEEQLPRLVPGYSFPPYAYTPGLSPHPTRDPEGHNLKIEIESNDTFTPTQWEACESYLLGFDMFNHGFYWEAHEAWEALWQAIERKGRRAKLLKGLIKLAACGVKARQASNSGVIHLAGGALKEFKEVYRENDNSGDYMGLNLKALIAIAEKVKALDIKKYVVSGEHYPRVFEFILLPALKKSLE